MTNTWLKRLSEQVHIQTDCQQVVQQPAEAGVDNAQLLISLPFEIMRQYLESVMRRQLDIATSIYSKQAEELDKAFTTHVDKFEVAVRTKLEKPC